MLSFLTFDLLYRSRYEFRGFVAVVAAIPLRQV